MEHRVAAIILTVDQRDKTLRCLASLRSADMPGSRVLLWDNGSSDDTAERVQSEFPDVAVHRHPRNLGAAAGRNAAVEEARRRFDPTHLLFLDNDMVVELAFLTELLRPFAEGDARLAQTTSKVLVLDDPSRLYEAGGSTIHYVLGRTWPRAHGEPDDGRGDESLRCLPSSGSMLVRADVFQEVGGFDPVFDPYGLEDLDFSMRVRKAGYHALYVPTSVVRHERSQTFEGGRYTRRYGARKARNWITFLRRHGKLHQRAGFYLVGAPLQVLRVAAREVRAGNLGGLLGVLQGGLAALFGSGSDGRPR